MDDQTRAIVTKFMPKDFYSRNDGGEGAEETRSLEGIFMCSFTPHLKDRYATFTYTTHG